MSDAGGLIFGLRVEWALIGLAALAVVFFFSTVLLLLKVQASQARLNAITAPLHIAGVAAKTESVQPAPAVATRADAEPSSTAFQLKAASEKHHPFPDREALHNVLQRLEACAGQMYEADPHWAELDRHIFLIEGAARGQLAIELAVSSDRQPALIGALEEGSFDAILTTRAVLDAYYADAPHWEELKALVGAAEFLLRAALSNSQILVTRASILEVVDRRAVSNRPTADMRRLSDIPEIRAAAARKARDVGDAEALIVDLRSPGWSSPTGSSPPMISVFDRSSWT